MMGAPADSADAVIDADRRRPGGGPEVIAERFAE